MELDWGPDWNLTKPEVQLRREPAGNQPYLLCGHLDKVVSFLGDTFVLDHKTTKSTIGSYYFDQYEPNNQMTLYTIAGRVIFHAPVKGVIIDACQSAVSFSRFERGLTYRTQAQLDEWLKDLHYWFEQAERYATDEYWPMNDTSCFNCDFNRHGKKICAKDPSVRKA